MKRIILGAIIGSVLMLLLVNIDRIIAELQAAAIIVNSDEAAPQPSLQNMVRIVDVADVATPLPQPTQTAVVVMVTAVPQPTVPALNTLPNYSPYTPKQIATCRAAWQQGIQNQLVSPQYEICKMYLNE